MNRSDNPMERRAALLQAAAQVGHNITSILDPDELLEQTVDIICDAFGFYYAGVFLVDNNRRWAILRAGHGEAGKAMLAENHRLEVGGQSMIGAATGRRQALIALDVGDEPAHFKNPHLPHTRSEMALPLMVGNALIGALTVQSQEEAAFNDDDITTLQNMADQLAIAIQNARLHQQNKQLLARFERRARLLQAAAQVGRDLTSILDLDDLLKKTVDAICDAYEFYYAGVFLVDDSGEWVELHAGRGQAGAAMLAEKHRLEIGGHSMIGAATGQRNAHIALDVGEEPVHFKNPHLPLTRSEMALPLVVGDTLIGALTIQSSEAAAFSDNDITSLQTMADQLAIAINNAQLMDQLEAAHAELVRSKTFEAIATATTEAIHWIGNKTLPIADSAKRIREDLTKLAPADASLLDSMQEDLDLIENGAQLIISVQEHLIGPAREQAPRPAMLDDLAKDVMVEMGLSSTQLIDTVSPNLPLVLVDTTQLHRAIGYVLENALEAVQGMPKPHISVTIAPEKSGRFVALRIADNGPGIPPDKLDKIWAAFYTTKGAIHAGLGLSACLQILQQIGGRISAQNLPEGGLMFELLLPIFDAQLPTAELSAGLSILLVDDEDSWSSFATETLSQAGNTASHSSTGEVSPANFDLILLDHTLETADSQALFQQLNAADKIVVISSSLRVEQTLAWMNLGAKDVILKPYTPAELAQLLNG